MTECCGTCDLWGAHTVSDRYILIHAPCNRPDESLGSDNYRLTTRDHCCPCYKPKEDEHAA